MKKIDVDELLEIAKKLSETGISWHHHFFTPKCQFNKSKNFQIILENEDSNKTYFSEFTEKPMEKLKKLENLFFKQK